MRDIIFKGKRLGETEWHYGSLVNVGGICQIAVFDEQAYKEKGEGGWDIFDFVEYITVDPSKICQYTGLTDKNGKKAFEGDIAKTPSGKNVVIEYGYGRFGLNLDYGTGETTMLGSWGSLDNLRSIHDGYLDGAEGSDFDGCEIIGNCFDNPELLQP